MVLFYWNVFLVRLKWYSAVCTIGSQYLYTSFPSKTFISLFLSCTQRPSHACQCTILNINISNCVWLKIIKQLILWNYIIGLIYQDPASLCFSLCIHNKTSSKWILWIVSKFNMVLFKKWVFYKVHHRFSTFLSMSPCSQ